MNIQSKGKIDKDNIANIYLELVSNDGIGPIYALAVVYLLIKGEYPIYDRFVRKANETIKNNKKPGEEIRLSELSLTKVPKQYLE